MNQTTAATVVIVAMIAAYAFGQANQPPKQHENCCCKHMQQLAEDVRFIKSKFSFKFTPPPDINPKMPGPLNDPGPVFDPGPFKDPGPIDVKVSKPKFGR